MRIFSLLILLTAGTAWATECPQGYYPEPDEWCEDASGQQVGEYMPYGDSDIFDCDASVAATTTLPKVKRPATRQDYCTEGLSSITNIFHVEETMCVHSSCKRGT